MADHQGWAGGGFKFNYFSRYIAFFFKGRSRERSKTKDERRKKRIPYCSVSLDSSHSVNSCLVPPRVQSDATFDFRNSEAPQLLMELYRGFPIVVLDTRHYTILSRLLELTMQELTMTLRAPDPLPDKPIPSFILRISSCISASPSSCFP